MAQIFDRRTGQLYQEIQYGGKSLDFLYNTVIGRLMLKLFVTGKLFSCINARREESRRSAKKIAPFIEHYRINMNDYEPTEYKSFADFFRRKAKESARPVDSNEKSLISVADSKLTVYKISNELTLKIKNSIYTVEELLQDEKLSDEFRNGLCLVFRLTVDDYHHFCFPDNGIVSASAAINGVLHTVSPISSKRYKVFVENSREYSVLETENFGKIVQMEIGALLVGKIKNYDTKRFVKGEEKGWFELGGSTVVLLLKENSAVIDSDIMKNSADGTETKVLCGERIGSAE